jgi:hypothetical protein
VKVGDLLMFEEKLHVVTKERVHVFSLQRIGCTWPPSIIGKMHIKDMEEYKTIRIISKA